MPIIRPRLTDHFGILKSQSDLDFAIPFLDEDIPLYLDPFLLWKSPSQQDQSLHTSLVNAFNNLGHLMESGSQLQAIENLIISSECDEIGLGSSATRKGKRIGAGKAKEILELFAKIPRYSRQGFKHFEEIQFYIDGISKDRISDISCSFLKSFLIDFTTQQCEKVGLPTENIAIDNVYNYRKNKFEKQYGSVPLNPLTGEAILLVPKRWLRFVPWINYDDYFTKHCPQDDISHRGEELTRVEVLDYNRDNYGVVEAYIAIKERAADDCFNDPLFSQIPITSAKRKWHVIKQLPTGKIDNSDQKYEKTIGQLMPSLLYPKLDFAIEQARAGSGATIRDLLFYNTANGPFLEYLNRTYNCRQITMEMKNVAQIDREHIDQLNRYLADEMGKFGIFVTRNPLKKAEQKRSIDLWSGQRKAIIALTDSDVEQMVEIFESKQREPLDVIVKKYNDFRAACP